MNARTRYRRIRAWCRASKRESDETVRLIRASNGWWNFDARRMPALALLRERERHAHARLPVVARLAVL